MPLKSWGRGGQDLTAQIFSVTQLIGLEEELEVEPPPLTTKTLYTLLR